jgi:hypothetical protein
MLATNTTDRNTMHNWMMMQMGEESIALKQTLKRRHVKTDKTMDSVKLIKPGEWIHQPSAWKNWYLN